MILLDPTSDDNNEGQVGYQKPPKSTRFAKGRSGNPAGRPPGRRKHPKNQAPYESVLGQMVTVRQDGREKRRPADEAFLLQLVKLGMEGNIAASRAARSLIETGKAKFRTTQITRWVLRGFGSVSGIMSDLNMATFFNSCTPNARVAIQPWLVQAALARLPGQLTVREQQVVFAATLKPEKVRWPSWWSVRSRSDLPPQEETAATQVTSESSMWDDGIEDDLGQ